MRAHWLLLLLPLPSPLLMPLLILMLVAGTAQAQLPPGGGRPSPGGAPPGAMPPGLSMKMPTLEDLVPPDPLRLWHAELLGMRAALALDGVQDAAFEAWLRELRDLVTLNERRLWIVMGRSKPVVSARADVTREWAGELDQASERVQALQDLIERWKSMQALLSETQRDRIAQSYERSRVLAAQRAGSR
jgi:hypothetical protein